MGIPENLYACALCEKSFPIAKSLVDHVNRNHLPSKIEQKKAKETKIIQPAQDSNKQQKKDDTKFGPTKLQNEERTERKKIPCNSNHVSVQSKIEPKKEKETKIVKPAPSPNEQQKKGDIKIGTTKLQKEKTTRRKNNQQYVCNYCSKSFHLKCRLIEHIIIHTGEKPFLCKYCPKRFNRKKSLKGHERGHTGEDKFPCEYCSKTFTLKSSLKNHVKFICSGDKPFPCTFCDRRFARKFDVESHERIHTGEKPFSCTFCKKSFNRKDMLVLHTKRHTEGKPQCKYCGKGFLNLVYVQKHENNVCNKNPNTAQYAFMKKSLIPEEKPRCRYCAKDFSTLSYVQKHENVCNKNPNTAQYAFMKKSLIPEEKPKCRYCAKDFLTLSYVQKHENNVCKKKSQIAMNIYKNMKRGKEATGEIMNLSGNGYDSKVEGQIDCLVVKAVSKFGYHCKYCGKGFLNSTYVKKHEDNVCKKKSGYTKFIYAKFDGNTEAKC